MEIIFASTGVECVAAPSRGVIFLDPTLDYESAIAAIHASMPSVHIDAVRHWVDKAMPTVAARARPHHNPPARFGRLRRVLAVLSILAFGAGATWGGLYFKHRYLDNVFDNAVFAELVRDRGWHCNRGLDEPMNAGCVTRDGVLLRVIATTSSTIVSFMIDYDVADTPQTSRLLVFDTAEHAKCWMALERVSEDGLYPNLVADANWMLYGTEAKRIEVWAGVLPHEGTA